MGTGGGPHGVDRDRLDAGPVVHELLERQAMHGESAEGADDRARRFEPEREDADQEIARCHQLGLADRRVAHPLELGDGVDHRGHGDFGVDRGAGRERAGPTTHVEAGAGAVGVALLLAQPHVEPGVEQTAEDGRHDRHGVEVGDLSRQTAMTDADLGLDGARAVDDTDDPAPTGGAVDDDRAAIGAGRSRGPVREQAGRDGQGVQAPKVAPDHERGPRRIERPVVGSPEHVGFETGDRLGGPARGTVIRRVRGVDRRDVDLVGTAAWVRLGLEQVVQPLVAQPLDLIGRERRPKQDLGQQLQGRLEPGGRHVDAHARRVPAGLGMERGAKPLGRFGQSDRVVIGRALGHGPGGQHGDAALIRRLVDRADGQDHRCADQRPTGQVDDEDGQAVGEPIAADRGEVVRSRGPRGRPLGDDRAIAFGRVRGHAASSSSVVSARSASFAALSAVGVSGRYVMTRRLSGRNVAAATSRIASGVTDR